MRAIAAIVVLVASLSFWGCGSSGEMEEVKVPAKTQGPEEITARGQTQKAETATTDSGPALPPPPMPGE